MNHKPNFLLLFSDQQRFDTIGAAGFTHMKTPHLDRLVREGCLFTNAYSPNPVCMPARHYLLTGMTARQHGYFGNTRDPIRDDGIPTLPRVLSDHGYITAAVGKMHFHPPERHHGFLKMKLMEEIPHHSFGDAYKTHLIEKGVDVQNLHGVRPFVYHLPQKALMPDDLHGSRWVADEAVNFMEQNKTQPFFLMCGWIKPHPPWNIPEKYRDYYKDADLPEPIPVSRTKPYLEEESDWFGDNDSDEHKRKIREAYYTSVSMVDDSIGKILEYMEKQGLLDNTAIIFSADHGEMLQDKGYYQKMLPYESASRIPFIVRYPEKFGKGSKDDRFVDLMDIFPTMLDLAGINYHYKESDKNYNLDGDSLLSEKCRVKDRAYQWIDYMIEKHRWIALRDKNFKYIYHYNGAIEEFYDLKNDPREINNLIGSGSLPGADYERLRKKCISMEEKFGPPDYIKNGNFISFPYENFGHTINSKYPFWSNDQFQTYGEASSLQRARKYTEEVKNALGADEMRSCFKNTEWVSHWKKNFIAFGGTEAEAEKFLKAFR